MSDLSGWIGDAYLTVRAGLAPLIEEDTAAYLFALASLDQLAEAARKGEAVSPLSETAA